MFRDRPGLLDEMFNRGNQAGGAQRRALAGSIAGFATALLAEPGTRPDTLLDPVAHKHAAEVLGDAVTPEVAAACAEHTAAGQGEPATMTRASPSVCVPGERGPVSRFGGG